jgi:SAM-dependent methyltransferase
MDREISRRGTCLPRTQEHVALPVVRRGVSSLQATGQGRREIPVEWFGQLPRLLDKTATTRFAPDYLYHPAWAARILAKNKPERHIDISSVLHFSVLVSAFMPVEFYDYRPAAIRLGNLACKKADLLALPFEDNAVESISCMHTIEHVGLGRYGDPLDPQGDLKAIGELKRVLAPGGTLLFVTPVGRPRLEFNAHRIYSRAQIVKYFSGLILKEFTLIPDNALEVGMIEDATEDLTDRQEWSCGCFWFTK